ncbi:HlyD family secretion protein [Clostridium estertheticum]|uniref:HlyD family secretion protein n=1 Tax=Clostridium estertheticum TaxID=238834 RepID=UPI001C7D9F6B|nr:HlyD family efflux transporter periplasmic adaptor subunit [Clostridium estertheticum]MBX4271772.1 HlyD family efflux transporter periplasmic adaptor subunit [Clostridium estertheticum]WLC82476.1 HlyD family efflux transporter periplasmic adaptor subunit [Clostridium estertheticum]
MKVYNLNELTDRRVLYDKNPPKFMIYIIALVSILLVLFLVWANKSTKTYIVKGQGIITTENKSQIMAAVSGAVVDVYALEGKEVKARDILVTLDPVEPTLQSGQADDQIKMFNKRITLLIRAEKNATALENSFDKNKADEAEFYNKLKNNYTKGKAFAVDEEALKKQGGTKDQIEDYKRTQKIKLDENYYDTILQFTTEKTQLELEKKKLEIQKTALGKSAGEFKILAPKNGKLHLSANITKGMVLQAGSTIGSITNKEEKLIVETLLTSSERPRIQIGDEVAVAVAGLNQAEYGTIKGKVLSIDQDATIDSEKGNVYFKVKVKLDKTYLTDKKGEKVNLTLGMVTETRVKYEKITYMKYFMEQIGIKLD